MPEGAGPAESEVVFTGPLFSVHVERWTDPDRRRDIVRHRGAVAVVALTEDGRVVLIRQLREAVGRAMVEIPAGTLDVPGEAPETAAVRELAEETGLRVRAIRPLHPIHTSPGFVDEAIHLFLADVEGEPVPGEDEGITEVELVPLEEAVARVYAGEIEDAKSALGLLLAERVLRREDSRAPDAAVDEEVERT